MSKSFDLYAEKQRLEERLRRINEAIAIIEAIAGPVKTRKKQRLPKITVVEAFKRAIEKQGRREFTINNIAESVAKQTHRPANKSNISTLLWRAVKDKKIKMLKKNRGQVAAIYVAP